MRRTLHCSAIIVERHHPERQRHSAAAAGRTKTSAGAWSSNLPAVARFPAAFYLLIQLGFVRTPRLHLEPAEESVLHTIQEETAASENRKKKLWQRFFL